VKWAISSGGHEVRLLRLLIVGYVTLFFPIRVLALRLRFFFLNPTLLALSPALGQTLPV